MDAADYFLGTIAITLCELLIGISSVFFVFCVDDGWNEFEILFLRGCMLFIGILIVDIIYHMRRLTMVKRNSNDSVNENENEIQSDVTWKEIWDASDLVYTFNLSQEYSTRWLMLRGFVRGLETCCYYRSLVVLGLGDTVTLANTNAIWSILLEKFFFSTKIEKVHYVVAILSIVGVICVAQPTFIFSNSDSSTGSGSSDELAIGYLLALSVALLVSIGYLSMRKVSVYETLSAILIGTYSIAFWL